MNAPTNTAPAPSLSSAADFFARVATLRRDLAIAPAKGGTRDRQRIALAVADAYLRTLEAHAAWEPIAPDRWRMAEAAVRMVHHVPMLEWQVFEALAGLGLTCAALPEELRCEEQVKDRHWDPVRLFPRPQGWDGRPGALVARVVEILTQEGVPDGEPEESRRIRGRRGLGQDHGRDPDHAPGVARLGDALHQARAAGVLPRARRRRLAEDPGAD